MSETVKWCIDFHEIQISDEIIGKGAFGEVRVAKWRNIPVACKSNYEKTTEDEDADELLLEVHILSKLRHPNLVMFLGYSVDYDRHKSYLLTELMPCSLYDVLENRKLSLELPDVIDLSLGISNGLDYLHQHNPAIIHRDISAKNILLTGNTAKIADLGQAKLFDSNALSRQTGMPGAMAYSAPEVLTGKYSIKIDIFSFGVLICQMITGEYPRIDRREEQFSKAFSRYPVLQSILAPCISFNPNERPSAMDAATVLNNIKDNDRYYPPIRRQVPEKDIGVLARQWLQQHLKLTCDELQVSFDQANRRLQAEELRWEAEASKVDGLQRDVEEARRASREAADRYEKKAAELTEALQLNHQKTAECFDLKNQLDILSTEVSRLKSKLQNQEVLLAQGSINVDNTVSQLQQTVDKLHHVEQVLDSTRASEHQTFTRLERAQGQLQIQLEYSRDLEDRLEQALTRWKQDKETLNQEAAKSTKLSNQSASILKKYEKLREEFQRCDTRLRMYEGLPMPEEIKHRLQDTAADNERLREDLHRRQLLEEDWIDQKSLFEQMVLTRDAQILELEEASVRSASMIESRDREINNLQNSLQVAQQEGAEATKKIQELQQSNSEILEDKSIVEKRLDQVQRLLVVERQKSVRSPAVTIIPHTENRDAMAITSGADGSSLQADPTSSTDMLPSANEASDRALAETLEPEDVKAALDDILCEATEANEELG